MQISGIDFLNTYRPKPFSQRTFANSSPAFQGRIGADGYRMQKSFAHYPCPCCGIEKMLTYKDIRQIMYMSEHMPAKDVINALGKYENSMHDVEKEIFHILRWLSGKYPEKNLRELLDTQRPKHLQLLHERQNKIIDRLHFIGNFLSANSQKKLEETLKESQELLSDKTCNEQFKRRVFVGKIKYLTMGFPEEDLGETICKISEEMPKANNSVPAFIVKFTEKKPATGIERSPMDIVFAILYPSMGSIEHVKVRSRNICNGGGPDKMSNYLLECARDNNERSSMPLKDFIKLHPEFYGVHLQAYMDKAIEDINSGTVVGLEKYPEEIAKTLLDESDGKIKVDISKLNPPNA